MKKIYFLFFLICSMGMAQNVTITKVIETDCSSPFLKTVELYVDGTVDFSTEVVLNYMQNGDPWADNQIDISGFGQQSDTFLYIVRDIALMQAEFPSTTFNASNTLEVGTSTNGDDGYQIVLNGIVVSQFGETETDGTNTAWETKDAVASRMSGLADRGIFDISHWEFTAVDALDSEVACNGGSGLEPYFASLGNSFPLQSGSGWTPACLTFIGEDSVSCATQGAGLNDDTYTATLPFSGANNGNTFLVTSSAGTVAGDDPSTVESGSIIVNGIPEGTDVMITVSDTADGGVCDLTRSISSPACIPLVLNEMLFDPASDISGDANGDGVRDAADDEFVEFYNNSNAPLDLSGYTLSDDTDVRHTFPAATIIPSNGFLVVFGGGTPTGTFGGAIVQTASEGRLNLNNGGDDVIVANSNNNAAIDFNSSGISVSFSDDQSVTRNPDITGTFEQHAGITEANGALFSPGTNLDGTPGAIAYRFNTSGWEPSDPTGTMVSASSDIYVSSSLVLAGDLNFQNIYITATGSIDLGSNTLNAARDVISRGSFTADEGTINFNGSVPQQMDTEDLTLENLEVNNAAGVVLNSNLNLEGILTLTDGALTTQPSTMPTGVLTFKSSDGKSAIVDQVVSGSINGEVSVEQFYPANRAFRFISSPVDMSGSIFSNWQQGGLDPGDVGFEEGIGTQITGGTTADGFDQSSSGAPSAFEFNNSYTDPSDAWIPLSSTNMATPFAGTPYRILIRGDRRISINTGGNVPTNTKLISRGSIVTGTADQAFSPSADNFALIGNPYQAQVDLSQALAASEDVNSNFYYAWQPLSENYVAYNFSSGGVQNGVTENIQPGQSFFVAVVDDGDATSAFVAFEESFKVNNTSTTATYDIEDRSAFMTLELFNSNSILKDRVLLNFSETDTNDITVKDAPKFRGPHEQLMTSNNGLGYSIERRRLPDGEEIIPLRSEMLQMGNYTMKVEKGVFDIPAYLLDDYTGDYHALTAGVNTIAFNVNNDQGSYAEDRFSIVFSTTTLSSIDAAFAKAISLYPNPTTTGSISIKGLASTEVVDLELYDLAGQLLFEKNTQNSQSLLNMQLPNVNAGIYFIKISKGKQQATLKLVIQ